MKVTRLLRRIGSKRALWLFMVTVAALTGSCATKSGSDRRSLPGHPEALRRVMMLPICFSGSARADETLTLLDLKSLDQQAGSNLESAVVAAFAAKGIEVVMLGHALCGDEDWDQLDPDVHRLLEDAVIEFRDLIARQQQQIQQKVMTWPFPEPGPRGNKALPHRIESQLGGLVKLEGQEADAIVLWETTAHFESSAARHRRHRWNYTWGAVLTPLALAGAMASRGMAGVEIPIQGSSALVHHSMAIVDARTLQVVGLHTRSFPGRDVRDTNALRGSVHEMLAGFRLTKSGERK